MHNSSLSKTVEPTAESSPIEPELVRQMLHMLYEHTNKTNKEVLNYTLRDGPLDGPCSYDQFERDFLDVLSLVNVSRVYNQTAGNTDISNMSAGYNLDTGIEHDLTQRRDVQRAVTKELRNPAAEIICISDGEATHMAHMLSMMLDIMAGKTNLDSDSPSTDDSSRFLAKTHPQNSFTGIYLNKKAMGELGGLGIEVLSAIQPPKAAEDSVDIAEHNYSEDALLSNQRYRVLQARSALGNLAAGNIRFPTEKDVASAQRFLNQLLPEFTHEIDAFRVEYDNAPSPSLRATAQAIHDHINAMLSSKGIEAAHHYVLAQRAIGENPEFAQRLEAIRYFNEHSSTNDSGVTLALDGAPENSPRILVSLVGARQRENIYLDESTNTLHIPSFPAEQIEKNWDRFLKLAHKSTLEDAIKEFPLESVELPIRVQPDPNAITSVQKIQTLQEAFPEEMRVIDAVNTLLERIDTPQFQKSDKYLSSSHAVELHFQNGGEQSAARNLLRHITEDRGVVHKPSFGLLIESGERETVLAFRELFKDTLESAREAIKTGNKEEAGVHLHSLQSEHLGESGWNLAQEWSKESANIRTR